MPKNNFSSEIQQLQIILESGENFLLKDLTEKQLHALCSGMTKYIIKRHLILLREF